ncbi:MAG: hypothetical protein Kow00128_19190 [Deltaproteobacteria bacterium]
MAGEIVNGTRLARIVGTSTRTVTKWRSAGMPVHEDRGRGRETLYNTAAVIAWLVARDGGGKADSALTEARRRILEAEAGRRELRLAKEQGDVVDVRDAAKVLEKIVLSIKGKVLGMGDRLTPRVVGSNSYAEVKKLIDDFGKEVLLNISQIDPAEAAQTTLERSEK